MRYAFDLDGTLADTRAAVLAAYREAGVEPPSDFFERSAKEWLIGHPDAEELHRRKNALYLSKYVNDVVRLPLADALLDAAYSGSATYVLTAASLQAATAVLKKFGLLRSVYELRTGLTKEMKAERLRDLSQYDNVVYFDDSESTVEYLRRNTACTICLVRSPSSSLPPEAASDTEGRHPDPRVL